MDECRPECVLRNQAAEVLAFESLAGFDEDELEESDDELDELESPEDDEDESEEPLESDEPVAAGCLAALPDFAVERLSFR